MRTPLIAGFTLIEVLVAVLVLAIGILGAAGAQVAALRTRHSTGLMSGGVQLASTLADRMRAHGAAGATSPYLEFAYDAVTDGKPAAPGVACFSGSACTSAQMAAYDLYETRQALYTLFPGARIAVCRDATVWSGRAPSWACENGAAGPVVIKLGWRGKRAAGGAEPEFVPAVALVVGGGGA